MKSSNIPFNLDLLQITPALINNIRAVTALDTYSGLTKNFHEDGLYSTITFGTVGSEARSARYGYINLKIPVFHPTIYNALLQLKGMYGEIIASKEFAIWDSDINDFVKSNALEGQTGFEFFVEHWKKIVYVQRPSVLREQNILMIEKYKDVSLTDKVIVMPAAYRDMEVDDSGRESSDDINKMYYKLIAISNTINPSTVKISPEAYNGQRVSLQNTFIEIYEYILAIVEGKKNLLMGKWASRKVFNGTRNVITSMDTTSSFLNAPGNISINDTDIGIYQCMKAMLPVSRYHLKNGFLGKVFTDVGAPALLTNKNTLQSERVELKADTYNEWMTNEGLDNFIGVFKEPSVRSIPIKINGYYLGLVYKGPDDTFKLIHGIDDLPEGRVKEDCIPITMALLFYCSIYHIANKYPGYVTRYPILGPGSIYPSHLHLKSTIKSEVRKELGDDWEPLGEDRVAYEFPTDSDFFNSMSPHSCRLSGLNADFDGDTSSCTVAYSDEAIKEVDDFFKSKIAYIDTNGEFIANLETDTVKYLLQNLTG